MSEAKVVVQNHWTHADIARETGVEVETIGFYERQGRLPPRNVVDGDGEFIGWTPDVAKAWIAARPGARARTDLAAGERPARTQVRVPGRRDAALAMHEAGSKYGEIAAALGYASAESARKAVQRGKQARLDPTV